MFKILSFAVGVAVIAGVTASLTRHAPAQLGAPPYRPSSWTWTKESWTGDERPYRTIRDNIDKSIRSGQENPDALLARHKASAQKQPSDPQALFRWGYAAYWASSKSHGYNEKREKFDGVLEAFAKAPSPHSYEYARLRFLVEAATHPVFPLIPVGERLLERDPQDLSVKYQLRKLLSWSPSLENKRRALQYSLEMVRSHPKHPTYHAALGMVYLELWYTTRDPIHADKAINAYKQYLRLAPPRDEFLEAAKRLIDTVEREKAQYKKDR